MSFAQLLKQEESLFILFSGPAYAFWFWPLGMYCFMYLSIVKFKDFLAHCGVYAYFSMIWNGDGEIQ